MLPTFRKPSPRNLALAASALMIALYASPALASGSGSGMPYDDFLNTVLASITGPVAKIAGVVAISIGGLGVALGEGGPIMKVAIRIIFGLSIAFNAGTWGLTAFGFTGGAAF